MAAAADGSVPPLAAAAPSPPAGARVPSTPPVTGDSGSSSVLAEVARLREENAQLREMVGERRDDREVVAIRGPGDDDVVDAEWEADAADDDSALRWGTSSWVDSSWGGRLDDESGVVEDETGAADGESATWWGSSSWADSSWDGGDRSDDEDGRGTRGSSWYTWWRPADWAHAGNAFDASASWDRPDVDDTWYQTEANKTWHEGHREDFSYGCAWGGPADEEEAPPESSTSALTWSSHDNSVSKWSSDSSWWGGGCAARSAEWEEQSPWKKRRTHTEVLPFSTYVEAVADDFHAVGFMLGCASKTADVPRRSSGTVQLHKVWMNDLSGVIMSIVGWGAHAERVRGASLVHEGTVVIAGPLKVEGSSEEPHFEAMVGFSVRPMMESAAQFARVKLTMSTTDFRTIVDAPEKTRYNVAGWIHSSTAPVEAKNNRSYRDFKFSDASGHLVTIRCWTADEIFKNGYYVILNAVKQSRSQLSLNDDSRAVLWRTDGSKPSSLRMLRWS